MSNLFYKKCECGKQNCNCQTTNCSSVIHCVNKELYAILSNQANGLGNICAVTSKCIDAELLKIASETSNSS